MFCLNLPAYGLSRGHDFNWLRLDLMWAGKFLKVDLIYNECLY